jgi:hypothetical protein
MIHLQPAIGHTIGTSGAGEASFDRGAGSAALIAYSGPQSHPRSGPLRWLDSRLPVSELAVYGSMKLKFELGISLIDKISSTIEELEYLGIVYLPLFSWGRISEERGKHGHEPGVYGRRLNVLPIVLDDAPIP